MDGATDVSAVMISLDTGYEAGRNPGSPIITWNTG